MEHLRITTAAQLEQVLVENKIDPTGLVVAPILDQCYELEHQGMEPGAYSVNMEQYLEVALDIIQGLTFGR